ncbi:hypothetical protein C2W62_16665 [Candidatus Entotheonella serta]|nr:hypothetical protein C2W62_16665 [Candidatus Entotheonella serta]
MLSRLILSCCLIGIASVAHAQSPSPTPATASTSMPLYTQVLAALQQDHGIMPWAPDVHPLRAVYNREAIIPPQCYTRTEGTYNPCYVCHQDAIKGRENVMNDGDLQVAYSFSDMGMKNHWQNLFEDRSERVAKISDADILDYIRQDNYSELPGRLQQAKFTGWIPDLKQLQLGAKAFDEQGFAKDGSHWVAYNYKPLPSTFWPTNGSTDDVMIRLPAIYRSDAQGRYSHDIYKANLAILEAHIKGARQIGSLPIDENIVGVDLNGDGTLGIVQHITKVDRYVGAAADEYADTHLYPAHTEFPHTVRYVGVSDDDEITVSTRMKEVRYMRKWVFYAKPVYARRYELESFKKEAGNLPGYHNLGHKGLDNGSGWSIQGFIEDKDGRLRVSTFEENFFCMGCHSSVGATIDKTFSFARKIDGAQGWGYIDLKGMPDAPNQGERKGEIATYFERVGDGGEFRSNPEMFARWFNPDGTVNHQNVSQAKDVYDLITPSKQRALMLNKAYRVIVEDQDFIFGRDATVTPPKNVYHRVDNDSAPTLPPSRTFKWDMRLDWEFERVTRHKSLAPVDNRQ